MKSHLTYFYIFKPVEKQKKTFFGNMDTMSLSSRNHIQNK